jgi:hypothetical protein
VCRRFLGERRVLFDVEFFFPQWTQMIIQVHGPSANFTSEAAAEAMERFVVRVCQLSESLAGQLYFALIAAIEDCQPELQCGSNNPNVNMPRFIHCCRLVNLVFRAVTFGAPALTTMEEQNMSQHFSVSEMGALYDAERTQRVDDIITYSHAVSSNGTARTYQDASFRSSYPATNARNASYSYNYGPGIENYVHNCAKSGQLMFKRNIRRSVTAPKPWKMRFFVVKDRILYCFHDMEGEKFRGPVRALHLSMCVVEDLPHANHPYSLCVRNPMTNTIFQLRALDETTFLDWKAFLIKYVFINGPGLE